ncbi:MAG: hypothetical protein ACPL68_06975 [Candidatus Hydrothermia bacterium]
MKIRGYALENLVDYISKTQDEETFRALRAKLPDEIVSGSWYPADSFFEVLEELERLSGEHRGTVSREVGRFKAQHAALGPYRLFFIFASPRFILKRAGVFWGFYHDWGRMKVREHYDRGVDFSVEHEGGIPELYLHTIAGWVEKSLEIAGAKCPKVDFTSTKEGADFRARWD